MSIKPENNFIGHIHKRLPKTVYHMKNNNPYTGGVPDCWYSGTAGDLWIEYKYIETIPKTVNIRPLKLLSSLQTDWLCKRYTEGRNVCVIIGCKEGGVVLQDRLWESELSPKEFASLLRPKEKLAQWITDQVM